MIAKRQRDLKRAADRVEKALSSEAATLFNNDPGLQPERVGDNELVIEIDGVTFTVRVSRRRA